MMLSYNDADPKPSGNKKENQYWDITGNGVKHPISTLFPNALLKDLEEKPNRFKTNR